MKLFNYMDNEFIKANIALQEGHDPSLKAKTLAITAILGAQKTILKWKWYFALLVSFVKCAILNKWPEKVDLEAYMREAAAKKVAAQVKPHSKDTECQPSNVIELSQN